MIDTCGDVDVVEAFGDLVAAWEHTAMRRDKKTWSKRRSMGFLAGKLLLSHF